MATSGNYNIAIGRNSVINGYSNTSYGYNNTTLTPTSYELEFKIGDIIKEKDRNDEKYYKIIGEYIDTDSFIPFFKIIDLGNKDNIKSLRISYLGHYKNVTLQYKLNFLLKTI